MPSDFEIARRPVLTVVANEASTLTDALIAEAPVEVRFNGSSFAVIMATPASLDDLVRGFAVTEGFVPSVDGITAIEVTQTLEGFIVDVTCNASPEMEARLLPSRSGCGLCGARTLEDAVHHWPPAPASDPFEMQAVSRALRELNARQALNALTGSAHAAAWVSRSGEILELLEDVGRHNALDKLLGALLASGCDFTSGFVLVTSRASYEMVSKVLRCGIGLLVAVSAPTALAVDMATSGNLALIAFARDGRYNLYSHPERLITGH